MWAYESLSLSLSLSLCVYVCICNIYTMYFIPLFPLYFPVYIYFLVVFPRVSREPFRLAPSCWSSFSLTSSSVLIPLWISAILLLSKQIPFIPVVLLPWSSSPSSRSSSSSCSSFSCAPPVPPAASLLLPCSRAPLFLSALVRLLLLLLLFLFCVFFLPCSCPCACFCPCLYLFLSVCSPIFVFCSSIYLFSYLFTYLLVPLLQPQEPGAFAGWLKSSFPSFAISLRSSYLSLQCDRRLPFCCLTCSFFFVLLFFLLFLLLLQDSSSPSPLCFYLSLSLLYLDVVVVVVFFVFFVLILVARLSSLCYCCSIFINKTEERAWSQRLKGKRTRSKDRSSLVNEAILTAKDLLALRNI